MVIRSSQKVLDAFQKVKRKKVRCIQRWQTLGENTCYFRSNWEYKFARYLEWLKVNNLIQEWQYEPKTFWFEGIKRGVVSYKPDFYVLELNGNHHWAEVKGYMDPKSKTKIKRMAKYHPREKLHIIDKKWFDNHAFYLKKRIGE